MKDMKNVKDMKKSFVGFFTIFISFTIFMSAFFPSYAAILGASGM